MQGGAAPTRMHKAKFVSAPPVGAMAHPGRQSQRNRRPEAQNRPPGVRGPKIIRLRQGAKPEAIPSLNDFAVR